MGRSIHAVTLFALHLSTHKDGMSKGPVKAVPAALAGHLCKVTLECVKPDVASVRQCLPRYYRAAFDRQGGAFWYDNAGKGMPYLTLYSARGKYLNTLYAAPYVFDPATP